MCETELHSPMLKPGVAKPALDSAQCSEETGRRAMSHPDGDILGKEEVLSAQIRIPIVQYIL